jgi:hypothetical protein
MFTSLPLYLPLFDNLPSDKVLSYSVHRGEWLPIATVASTISRSRPWRHRRMEPKIDDANGLKGEMRLSKSNNRRFFSLMLIFLAALILADGVVTRVLATHKLGVEVNPFLKAWFNSNLLLVIKLVVATITLFILWFLYKTRPIITTIMTFILIGLYLLVIVWNLMIF